MNANQLFSIPKNMNMKNISSNPINFIITIFVFFISFSCNAFGGELNVHLVNAISGAPLPNTEVVAYKKLTDGSLKWSDKKTTNTSGTVSFNFPRLEQDAKYWLRVNPYGTGNVYSDILNAPGSFTFNVGQIEAKVIQGQTNQPLANHKVVLREILADGKSKAVASGTTNTQGVIRFDPPKLGSSVKYHLSAINPFDSKAKFSSEITTQGKFTFVVGNKLLNVHLKNALSGEALKNIPITVYQQQADNSFKWFTQNKTDASGNINFDLPGLGINTNYRIHTNPYGTGNVYSEILSSTNSYTLNVGKVLIRLIDAKNNRILKMQKVSIFKKSPSGQLRYFASGLTNNKGEIHFDPPNLGTGNMYIAKAHNVFSENKDYFSSLIKSKGVINFNISKNNPNKPDLTKPQISWVSPTNHENVGNKGFEVLVAAKDNKKVTTVIFDVLDPVKGSSTGEATLKKGLWSFPVTSKMLTPGNEIKIYAQAFDDSNNKSEIFHTFKVIIDKEKPRINITSHNNLENISQNGFLLSGTAFDNTQIKQLVATVSDPIFGKIKENYPIEISLLRNRWALSVQKVSRNAQIQVLLTAIDFSGNVSKKTLTLNSTNDGFKFQQYLNRLTFGISPELLNEIKAIGPEAYLQQQLHPETIDDSEFEAILDHMGVPKHIGEIQNYQIAHSLYSKKQLNEIMTWFWDNHFNTDYSRVGTALTFSKNKNIRKHALGNFRDLLEISTTSPAMIIYLDNKYNHKNGPNENFARELMELHTLGINGGYTKKDVEEVAKVFTGWGVQDNKFSFKSWRHNYNEKNILSQTIPSGLGLEGGEMLLDILSTHTSTAKHLCTKLLQLFVTDKPAREPVDECAQNFLHFSDQDDQIARVIEQIFKSTYFSSNENFHNKVKTPYELMTSLLRQMPIKASYPEIRTVMSKMDMNLFMYPLPTGFPETGNQWINSNRYLNYVNFINSMAYAQPSIWRNYLISPISFFKEKGYETAEGVAGYLFYLALSNDYSKVEWNEAMAILTNNGKISFNISDINANEKIRNLIALVLSFPSYQLQ